MRLRSFLPLTCLLLELLILLRPAIAIHAQAQEKAAGFDDVPFTIIGAPSDLTLNLSAPNVVDLKTPGGMIFVSVRISGKSFWFLYNSSNYSCIDQEQIKLPVKTIKTEIHAEAPNENAPPLTISEEFVRVPDILIGNSLINNVDIHVCNDASMPNGKLYEVVAGGPVGGTIGLDYIHRWRIVVVDYTAHKMVLGK
jgi:hypothetical protein